MPKTIYLILNGRPVAYTNTPPLYSSVSVGGSRFTRGAIFAHDVLDDGATVDGRRVRLSTAKKWDKYHCELPLAIQRHGVYFVPGGAL